MRRLLLVFTRKRFYFILFFGFIILIAIGLAIGLIPVYLIPIVLSTTLTTTNQNSPPKLLETGSSNISVEVKNIGSFNMVNKKSQRAYSYICNDQEIIYDDFQYQTEKFLRSQPVYGQFISTVLLNFTCLSSFEVGLSIFFNAYSSQYFLPQENYVSLAKSFSNNAKELTPPTNLESYSENDFFFINGSATYQFQNNTVLVNEVCSTKDSDQNLCSGSSTIYTITTTNKIETQSSTILTTLSTNINMQESTTIENEITRSYQKR